MPVTYRGEFRYLDIEGNDLSAVEKKIIMEESTAAPVKKGEKAGEAAYYLNGKKIGSVDIVFGKSIDRAEYKDYLHYVLRYMLL